MAFAKAYTGALLALNGGNPSSRPAPVSWSSRCGAVGVPPRRGADDEQQESQQMTTSQLLRLSPRVR
jgi:hypothetical protein